LDLAHKNPMEYSRSSMTFHGPLSHSTRFHYYNYTMIYNKLTCTSKGERPPPNLLVLVTTRADLSPERPFSCRRELSPPLSLRHSFAQSRPLLTWCSQEDSPRELIIEVSIQGTSQERTSCLFLYTKPLSLPF